MVRSSKYRTATVWSATESASVFTSVRNIPFLPLTCSHLHRAIGVRGKPQRKRRAAPEFALDDDRAIELLDDALGNCEAKPETPPLGCDEVVEDRGQTIGGNARSRVGDADLDVVTDPRGRDGHAAAWRRRLDRVRHQVAVDAAQREAVALDDERLRRVARFDQYTVAIAFRPHRVDDLGH